MPERAHILGVRMSAINMAQALRITDGWIVRWQQHYVRITGVHGVMENQQDEALRRIHNEADLVTPDGMPLVWLSRLRGHGHVERVYGPDLMPALCAHSLSKGYKHFFYGGGEGVPELLANKLRQRFPGYRSWAAILRPSARSAAKRMNTLWKLSTNPIKTLS